MDETGVSVCDLLTGADDRRDVRSRGTAVRGALMAIALTMIASCGEKGQRQSSGPLSQRSAASKTEGPKEPSVSAATRSEGRAAARRALIVSALAFVGLHACSPSPERDRRNTSTLENSSMVDDRRAQGEEALAKLRRAVRAEGAELPVPRAEPAHAGFKEGETYVDPEIGRGVTFKYPILEDPELPGRYTITANPRESKIQFVLQASDGRAVAYLYGKYNADPEKIKTEQILRIYGIDEGRVSTPEVMRARSKLTMHRFASVAAAFMQRPSKRVIISYEPARPGEYL